VVVFPLEGLMRWTRWALIVSLGWLHLAAPAARGVDRVWVGGSGNWMDNFHWDPFGPPVSGDRIFATATDSLHKIITFNDNRLNVPRYASLLIDESGPGSVFLRQPGGELASITMAIGVVGPASYEINGGTATFGSATVDIRGSLGLSTGAQFNASSFTQRGPVTVFGQFQAGDYVQLAQRLYLGDGASYTGGSFRQQGQGVGTTDRTMRLTGTYLFNAGSFNVTPPAGQRITGGVSCATFEYNAAGSFGGALEVTQRLNQNVGSAVIAGDLVLRGATFPFANDRALHVRQDAAQYGGSVTQAGTFTTNGIGLIGVTPGTLRLGGGAQWTQTAGLNYGGRLIIGAGEGGGATYTLGGGTVRYDNGGTMFLGHLSDGTFVHNGGTVTVAGVVVGGAPTATFGAQRGVYLKNGGVLDTGTFGTIIVGREGSVGGAFTQHAGLTSCRELILNENATNHAVLTITGGTFDGGHAVSHGTFNQSGGVSTFGGNFDGAGAIRVTGDATMNAFRIRQHSVHVGGNARILQSGNSFAPPTHRVLSLSFEDGPGGAVRGQWDLGVTDLVIDYSGASPLNDVKRYLASGHAGGNWNGTGLSSSAAALQDRALGYGEALDVLGPSGGTFSGVFADASSVLVKYTRPGDANLDGLVTLHDFNRLAANFGGSNKVWSQGDFTYDGVVNLQDFNHLAGNFGLAAGAAGVTPQDWAALAGAIPEPGSLLPCGIAVCAASARRRFRK
jgi:hypothetical protein